MTNGSSLSLTHVLVIHQRVESRRLLRSMLEEHDFHVTEASDAQEAMGVLRRKAAQVVIVDVEPAGNGLPALIESIRARGREQPWIVGTGDAQHGQLRLFDAASLLRVDALLLAPIARGPLIETIERLITSVRPRRPVRSRPRRGISASTRRLAEAEEDDGAVSGIEHR